MRAPEGELGARAYCCNEARRKGHDWWHPEVVRYSTSYISRRGSEDGNMMCKWKPSSKGNRKRIFSIGHPVSLGPHTIMPNVTVSPECAPLSWVVSVAPAPCATTPTKFISGPFPETSSLQPFDEMGFSLVDAAPRVPSQLTRTNLCKLLLFHFNSFFYLTRAVLSLQLRNRQP